MPHKDPTSYSIITYFWVTLLSAWGGVVSFLTKVKTGAARPFNLVEFVGEIATAAFSGLLAFWGCEAAGFDPLWTAVLVGISGHMGTRALYQIEILAQRKLGLADPTTETSHDQQP